MRPPSPPAGAGDAVELTLTITALGAAGDGVAQWDGRLIYVPDALPGETVRVRVHDRGGKHMRGAVIARTAAAPDRVPPPCAHFGACGGCAAQHMAPDLYAAWKRDRLATALARRGIAAPAPEPTVMVAPSSRRRARLAGSRRGAVLRLGFRARHSERLIPVTACPVLTPALERLIAPLGAALRPCADGAASIEVTLTETETGVDVVLRGLSSPTLEVRERLAAFAAASDLARLAVIGSDGVEPIVTRRRPRMTFGGVTVELPAAGFIQPTAAGEAAIIAAVLRALGDAPRVADLYAGCGAIGLALASRGARVVSFEGDAAQVAALAAASRRAGAQVATTQRNLTRRPLARDALAAFDAVVLDPPRAGALTQARALSASAVPCLAYVSCEPATFARDARALIDGGYRLTRLTPVDQFLWSHHLELVGVFER